MEINEFLIEDVFQILGKGIVVTGRVLSGRVRAGMRTNVLGQEVLLKKIETFKGTLELAQANEQVGLLLEGVDKKNLVRGETLIFN